MVLFVQYLLISEFILVEIPATTITLVVINNPTRTHLALISGTYIDVSVVLLAVVWMIVPGLYLYLAYSMFLRAV
jgi:hypothetical protein